MKQILLESLLLLGLMVSQHTVFQNCYDYLGNAKARRGEPESSLGRVFKFNLGCFVARHATERQSHPPASRFENSAQVYSC
jgi:hypothetical protein